jgi:succinyl-CoA synthetase alpha subunit
MALFSKRYPNLYKDSVSLMQISAGLGRTGGIGEVTVAMATEANLARMRDAGLALDMAPAPGDLVIALTADDAATAEAALAAADAALAPKGDDGGGGETRAVPLRSIGQAVERHPTSNLALISVPGRYAAAEAMKALAAGLDVMMFSDNVDEADEIALKRYAEDNDRLLMGPDCGTAIVNGLPLGFANVVRRGPVGVVAASGTGLQEVTVALHHLGAGISQAIGTGGRDLHQGVDGRSMRQAIRMLAGDPETELIILVSKPPAPAVAAKVLETARACGKPVVVHFLGERTEAPRDGLVRALSLRHAAEVAVALLAGKAPPPPVPPPARLKALVDAAVTRLAPGQKNVRGVFSGGTFCYEAQLVLLAAGNACESNAPAPGATPLAEATHGHGHSLVDMGDDAFTEGRPHPMIDPTLRDARLLSEAADPETAVILFDVVLGHGADADPGRGLVVVLEEATSGAAADGRELIVIAHVCGTELDPQPRALLIATLEGAGVIVAASNAEAAALAAHAIARIREGQA